MPEEAEITTGLEGQSRVSEDRHKLSILLALSHALGTEIVPDKLFAVIVSQVTEAMNAERSTLFLYDEASNTLWSKIAQGLDAQEIRVRVGDGLAGAAAQTLVPINIQNAYEDPRFNRAFDKRSGFRTRSILTLPILNQERKLVGVIQVLNKRDGFCFDKDDIEFLDAICIHIALSIDRTRLVESYVRSQRYQQSLAWARDIQTGILPKAFGANRSDVEVYATMKPAQEVGGDLYDYCLIDDNHLCFAIGDVSDKGVPAALFMAMARTAFNISARAGISCISNVLGNVNDFLTDNNDAQMFVTMFAGVLDLRTGWVSYSDGGHEDPFIIRNGSIVEQFPKKTGMALGISRGFKFEAGDFQLHPGDSLVLYTDGVNEAMNPQRKMFGTASIGQHLHPFLGGASAPVVASQIVSDVVTFAAGAPQSDDITVLVIRYFGPDLIPNEVRLQ